MRRVGCLHFEGAVGGPEVNTVGDTGAPTLVDLFGIVSKGADQAIGAGACRKTDHLGRLGAGNVELEVGVFFPVAEE